jgi:SAM-dependent methyltransferase
VATSEVERIRAEYARREASLPQDFYSLQRPANLFADQQRARALLRLMHREGLFPLDQKRILDVGCGDGEQLLRLESWGARPANLAGIDLLDSRLARAVARFGGSDRPGAPDLRLGDASTLPWPDETFDIVHQATVFTSMMAIEMKRAVAREIVRVLKPGGVLIWYDFLFDNPRNAQVRGIRAREIRLLFPGCDVRLNKITLAPPIARRLVPITWIGALVLESLSIFNTHYLAAIRAHGSHRSAAR